MYKFKERFSSETQTDVPVSMSSPKQGNGMRSTARRRVSIHDRASCNVSSNENCPQSKNRKEILSVIVH